MAKMLTSKEESCMTLVRGLRELATLLEDGLDEHISWEHYSEQPAADGGIDPDGLGLGLKAYILKVRYKHVELCQPSQA